MFILYWQTKNTNTCIYRITSNIGQTFYTFFPVEKLRCVLNLRNVHLHNFFLLKPISKNGCILNLPIDQIIFRYDHRRKGVDNTDTAKKS
jgi:hypothetical protein